jgi:hypothetical protein
MLYSLRFIANCRRKIRFVLLRRLSFRRADSIVAFYRIANHSSGRVRFPLTRKSVANRRRER